jgi:hypothetical protein
MTTTVRIPWSRDFANEVYWNEVCAWAIEKFGLPGERFMTSANVEFMDFIFPDDRDALMFSLRWNAQTIQEDQLTLELIGGIVNDGRNRFTIRRMVV